MGQYRTHVFVCTSGEDCPTRANVKEYVKYLRAEAVKAYPDDVWYHGVQESDLAEIVKSHIIGGNPVEHLRYDPGVKGANKTPDAH